ncbi:MAG TPA: glycosyl transferase family 1 [Caulobacteraceae bacterium]
MRRRVLFFGEGVTLAHVGRPFALAGALPAERFEAVVACPERYHRFAPAGVASRPLASQSPEEFNARLADGRRLHTEARLENQIVEDLRLIEAARPDVVVGDFRLSLAASARTAGVPYVSISNAYWDPDRPWRPKPPPLGGLKRMPPWAGRALFRLAWPRLMRRHAEPIAAVLARRGVDIGPDIRRAFTEADLTLYADFPSLHPDVRPSETRRFMGPLNWEPPAPPPPWWDSLPADRPLAYCTLGSSGDILSLQAAVSALREQGYTVIAATAGRAAPAPAEGLFAADYLPGRAAAARAELVVCNGGAPTANQALLEGRPVLGICGNLDQLLNMQALERAGAGLSLRSDRADGPRISNAIGSLTAGAQATAARALRVEGAGLNPIQTFVDALDGLAAGR